MKKKWISYFLCMALAAGSFESAFAKENLPETVIVLPGDSTEGEGFPENEIVIEGETSGKSEIVIEGQTPGRSETPTEEKIPGGSETPTEEKTPGESEILIGEETPGGSETPTGEESPGGSETPTEEEIPGESDAPTGEEIPGESETPIGEETPGESETPTEEGIPGESEIPTEEGIPGESETTSGEQIPQEGETSQTETDLCQGEGSEALVLLSEEAPPLFDSLEQAAAYIRGRMGAREGEIEVSFLSENVPKGQEVIDAVFEETGEATEGDYLKFLTAGYNSSISWSDTGTGVYQTTYQLQVQYRTTAQQEEEVNAKVEQVLEELGVEGKSTYETCQSIYDYITENVVYDYVHLGDSTYGLQYTAYAALINKTAVCEGYALLFYRMATQAGLSVRMITGNSENQGHAWNIVKIGDFYYNVDSTWDARNKPYQYFLKGIFDFKDHERDEEYRAMEFHETYPMSDFAYSEGGSGAGDLIAEGACGENAAWKLTKLSDTGDGLACYLDVTGTGPMYDYPLDGSVPWEQWRESISIVKIGEGIERIGAAAFAGHGKLKAVAIPGTVKQIGDYAFYDCNSLELSIPASVTSVGRFVIGGAYGETEWEYLSGEKKLVITGNGKMGEPYLPGSQTEMASEMVPWAAYKSQLKKAEVRDGVVNLSTYAFHGCRKLQELNISPTVTEIGEGAFSDNKELTYVCLPGRVQQIGHYAFQSCESLRSIHIPATVSRIGVKAFQDCPLLHSFYFYGDAPEAGESAFINSEVITIYYPPSARGWEFFQNKFGNVSLETWTPGEYDGSGDNTEGGAIKRETSGKYGEALYWEYDPETGALSLTGSGAMAEPLTVQETDGGRIVTQYSSQAVPWQIYQTQIREISIGEGITSLSRLAFYSMRRIVELRLPDSLEEIGSSTLNKCSGIKELYFPEGLKTIGDKAFAGCISLKDFYFEGDVPAIDDTAFTEVKANGYYPKDRPGWSDAVKKSYGGTINWIAVQTEITSVVTERFELDPYIYYESGDLAYLSGSVKLNIEGLDFYNSKLLDKVFRDYFTGKFSDESVAELLDIKAVYSAEDIGAASLLLSLKVKKKGSSCLSVTTKDGVERQSELTRFERVSEEVVSHRRDRDTGDVVIEADLYASDPKAEAEAVTWSLSEPGGLTLKDKKTELKKGYARITLSYEVNDRAGKDLYMVTGKSRGGVKKSWKVQLTPPVDVWNFANGYEDFGPRSEGYYLTREHYDLLTAGLEDSEKEAVTKTTNGSGKQVDYFNIDGKAKKNTYQEWTGSCYGMSSIVMLADQGWMSPEEIAPGRGLLRWIDKENNDDIESGINYFQGQFAWSRVDEEASRFAKKSQGEQVNELVTMAQSAASGSPVLIWFGGYNLENGKEFGHAIVGYGIESGNFQWDVNGIFGIYDCCIKIYDPSIPDGQRDPSFGNGEEQVNLYINTENSKWVIPAWNISSTTTDVHSDNAEDNGGLAVVLSSGSYFKSLTSSSPLQPSPMLQVRDGVVLAAADGRTYTIANGLIDGQRSKDGFTVLWDCDGGSAETFRILLPAGLTGYTLTPLEEGGQGGYAAFGDGYYLYGYAGGLSSVSFGQDGSVKLACDENQEFQASLTADEDIRTAPWPTVRVEGSGNETITLSSTDQGYKLKGENLSRMTVTVEDDAGKDTVQIHSDQKEVVLDDDKDGNLVVKEDLDGDGIFETVVETEDESKKCGDDLKWSYEEATGTLTISGSGPMYHYTTTKNYPNTLITDVPWETVLGDVRKVVLDERVTAIGDCAFSDASSLTEIVWPKNLLSIGENAFARCTSLTALQIPESAVELGSGVFVGCSSLRDVRLPSGLKQIKANAFSACKELRKLALPEGLEAIGQTAFNSCTSLTEVTFPETLERIGAGAYFGCTGLREILIPYRVKKIESQAFEATNLSVVKVASPMVEIGPSSNVFSNADKIQFFCYENSSAQAYLDFYGLKYQFLDSGGQTLQVSASGYQGDYDGEGHGIQVKVQGMPEGSYQIYYTEMEVLFGLFSTPYGNILSYSMMDEPIKITMPGKTRIYYYVCAKGYPIVKGSEVVDLGRMEPKLSFQEEQVTKKIGDRKFTNPLSGNTDGKLTYTSSNERVASVDARTGEVTLVGKGVCQIRADAEEGQLYQAGTAFYTLTVKEEDQLTVLEQPRNVTGVIGTDAVFQVKAAGEGLRYSWRYSLDGKVSDSSYFLAGNAASCPLMITKKTAERTYWCHITDQTGKGVNTQACRVSCELAPGYLANGVCGEKITWMLDQDGMLLVEGSGEISYSDISWEGYETEARMLIVREGITAIGEGAFYRLNQLTSIYLPGTLEKIGDEAFDTMLTSLVLPDHLKSIGDGAFADCFFNREEKILLPRSLQKIGAGAFYRCEGKAISVPPSVTEIGESAIDYLESVECEKDSYAHQYCLQNGISFKLVEHAGSDEAAYSGSCGNSVNWKFEPETGILRLWGSGSTDSYPMEFPGFYRFRHGITEILVEEGVTGIGSYLFYGFNVLKKAALPESLRQLCTGAFDSCIRLKEVNLKGHAPSLGLRVFRNTSNDLSIYIPSNGSGYTKAEWAGLHIKQGKWTTDKPADRTCEGGHEAPSVQDRQEATCGVDGWVRYVCGKCGEEWTETIRATGKHKFSPYVTVERATVLADGTKMRTCSVCNRQESVPVPKLSPTIRLTVTKLPLQLKKSVNVKSIVTGLAYGDQIQSWMSSSTKVAVVDQSGKVTGKKVGTAVITVTLKSGKDAKLTVKVQKKAVKTTKISGLTSKISLKKGTKRTLMPRLTPLSSKQKITYSTSNRRVAAVSSKGVVAAKTVGTAKVTVKSGSKKFVVTVKVTAPTPTAIKGIPAARTLKKGKRLTLKPRLLPSGSKSKITYYSSSNKVASVNQKGVVTAKKPGKTKITVKAGKARAICTVTVK